MPSLRPKVRWISLLALVFTTAWAGAAERTLIADGTPSGGTAIDAARLGSASAQIEFSRRPAWQAFRARHGDWKAIWNEATGTPHRAFGRSIPLRSFANEPAAVDRAVREFLAENPALFGSAPTLETADVTRAGEVWFVRYRQVVRGLPVLFSDWEFRVGSNGHLMAFGADSRLEPAGFDPGPRIPGAVAREAGRSGLAFDPSTDGTQGADRLYLLPVRAADGGTRLRPVYGVQAVTRKPRGSWLSLVDAQTGDVLWRQSLMDHDITGRVTAQVHLKLPSETRTVRSLARATVNVGTVATLTDTGGNYQATPLEDPVTVTTSFHGPYCTIYRQDAANASYSKSVLDPAVANVAWTTSNSNDAERDCFYHVNWARSHVKAIDPSYTANDYDMPVFVNWGDGGECDAYWDKPTNSLNFFLDGPTCPNTGTMPDIIWHEYAHSISYNLYYTHGAPFGLTNPALGEGLSDTFAALVGDDPIVGDGFYGPGTYLRTLDNTARWPEDSNPSSHTTGLILGGAIWDLRQSIGLAITDRIHHFAKYGLADDSNAGIAMNEYFVDVLVADDNDGNLGNGTPHMNQIVAAFNAHGIGTVFFIQATHAPLDDQISNGPFPVTATIQYNGPFGSLGPATLFYKYNALDWEAVYLQPTGNPDEYGAQIPRVSFGPVSYYIVVQDSYGGTQVLPPGAPARDAYVFIAGPASTLLSYDMETSPGWTVGASGDNATSGIWVRDTTVGTQAQPGEDHSPGGVQCWVTGNYPLPGPPGIDDVDGGKTTLVTGTFNPLSGGMTHPVVKYWRWFSNNTGDAPDEDPWQVSISNNNGSSWVFVENTTSSSNAWKRVAFLIESYVTPTTTMKMRFVAQDILNPSLVEAAVDDWSLLAYPVLGVGDATTPSSFALAPAFPNPFHSATHIRYGLPAAGRVELKVFDIHGRLVRVLAAGEQPAGERFAEWDGRSDAGRLVANGPYFLRLSQAGRVVSRAVMMLR